MIELIERCLAPLRRRIQLMVGRAIVAAIDDSDGIQRLQITLSGDETKDDVERIGQYGLASVPKEGAETVVLFLGGTRDHGVVIACDDRRCRLKGLQEGEVALYTDEGDKIHLKRGNKIDIETGELTVKVSKFLVETGKVSITNPTGELVAVLSDILDHIINAKTFTGIGPQPLVGAELPADKVKLDTFKE